MQPFQRKTEALISLPFAKVCRLSVCLQARNGRYPFANGLNGLYGQNKLAIYEKEQQHQSRYSASGQTLLIFRDEPRLTVTVPVNSN